MRVSSIAKAVGLLIMSTTALMAQAVPILVYDNPTVVDTNNAPDSSSDTIQASLVQQGNTVTTTTATTAADLSTALAGQQVFVIPEQAMAPITGVLDAAALDVIRNYVATGGGLIIAADYQGALNALFGYQLDYAVSNNISTLTSAALGTAFATGPVSLPPNDTTLGFLLSTLPGGAQSIYDDALTQPSDILSTVTLFQYGNGESVQLGWDWNDAAPLGSQDGGWLSVLNRAVQEVSGNGTSVPPDNPPPSGVPEPGSVFLMVISASALAAARRRRQ